MRKLFTIVVAVLLTASVFAQSPQKMSYQAVIRNSSDVLVTNTQIGMEINIRQGLPSGTIVYTETQTPTTNANGLVSIEIGGGAGFNTIDWSAGPYFIETKTAVVPPLTTYTITGTSQLLSVPYALHAKTAETVTGGITETDPLWTASPSFGITNTNISNWSSAYGWGNHAGLYRPIGYVPAWSEITSKPTTIVGYGITDAFSGSYTDLTNKPTNATTTANGFMSSTDKTKLDGLTTADGSETKVTAGTNVTVTGAGTTASPYVVNATGATTLTIGQAYQGGIIFWLDATGQHGLIAATADQSTGIQWFNGTYTVTNSVRDGVGAGKFNTERIIANQGAGAYAAQICANYQGGNYGDWYLPSKYELNLLYQQKAAVGGFAFGYYYWSSTEGSNNGAWTQGFGGGTQSTYDKDLVNRVRAVRAF